MNALAGKFRSNAAVVGLVLLVAQPVINSRERDARTMVLSKLPARALPDKYNLISERLSELGPFAFWSFRFVSNFVIRISDFEIPTTSASPVQSRTSSNRLF